MKKENNYNTEEMLQLMKLNEAITGVIPGCLETTYRTLIGALVKEDPSKLKLRIGKISKVVSTEEHFPAYTFSLKKTYDPADALYYKHIVPFEIELRIKPVALIEWWATRLLNEYDGLLAGYGYDCNDRIASANEEIDPSATSREVNEKLEQLLYVGIKNDDNYYPECFRLMSEIEAGISKLELELQQSQEKEVCEEWEDAEEEEAA